MLAKLTHLHPIERAAPQVRKLVLHPACVAVFLSLTVFFFIFYADNRYSAQSTFSQFLLTFGWGIIYFTSFYSFMGTPILKLIERNIPMTWCYFGFFLIIATIEAVLGFVFFPRDHALSQFFWHIVSTQVAIIPAIVICGLFFEADMRAIISQEPERLPYWMPIKRGLEPIVHAQEAQSQTSTLLDQLPETMRSDIIRLESRNQYVEVTTLRGQAELRMTLKAAIDALPIGEGLRLHRSIWLRRDQIADLVYISGNPRLLDIHGNQFPVSRSKVAELKRMINA